MEHPWNSPFLGGGGEVGGGGALGPKSPQNGPILLKFLPEVVRKDTESAFEESLKNSNFYRNGRYRKFGPPEDGQNRGKQKHGRQKFSHRAIQLCQPQPRSSSPLQMKNRINFCIFRVFFGELKNLILSWLSPVLNFKTPKWKSSCGVFFFPCFVFGPFQLILGF